MRRRSKRCCIPDCGNSRPLSVNDTFHEIPGRANELKLWQQIIISEYPNDFPEDWIPKEYAVICSKHFTGDCISSYYINSKLVFKLKRGAVPTIFHIAKITREEISTAESTKVRSTKAKQKKSSKIPIEKLVAIAPKVYQHSPENTTLKSTGTMPSDSQQQYQTQVQSKTSNDSNLTFSNSITPNMKLEEMPTDIIDENTKNDEYENTFIISIPTGALGSGDNSIEKETATGQEIPIMITQTMVPESDDFNTADRDDGSGELNNLTNCAVAPSNNHWKFRSTLFKSNSNKEVVHSGESSSEVLSRTRPPSKTYRVKPKLASTKNTLDFLKNSKDVVKSKTPKRKQRKHSQLKIKDLTSHFPGTINFGVHTISINFLDESLLPCKTNNNHNNTDDQTNNLIQDDRLLNENPYIWDQDDEYMAAEQSLENEITPNVSANTIVPKPTTNSSQGNVEKFKEELEATKSELNQKSVEIQMLAETLEKERKNREDLMKMLQDIQKAAQEGSPFAKQLLQTHKI